MKLIVNKCDIVKNENINIENVTIYHIREGLVFPQRSDVVIYVDYENDEFKILKYRDSEEFNGVIVEGMENLHNFI